MESFYHLKKYLKNWFKKNNRRSWFFLKGERQKNINSWRFKYFTIICYEVIFTELIQKSDANTNIIINISEDGWFGNSIGPYQHFAKSIYRAIEQDAYLIRSANKGV